jgi:hypothetical protein
MSSRGALGFNMKQLLLAVALLFLLVAGGSVNVTVDDYDEQILYFGRGWEIISLHSRLDFGGGHVVSTVAGDTAHFTFTGRETPQ